MPDALTGFGDARGLFPESWQTGAPGVLLLFIFGPMGSGIPLGVIMARDIGLNPLVTAFLYFLTDLLLAIIVEPELAVLRWLGTRNGLFARIGAIFMRVTRSAGLQGHGARGPLGLVLLSFTVEPITSRAAGQAAGHGFFAGWAFAIAGDMLYFALLMVSTLWASSVLGDDRLTIGVVLLAMWLVPMLIRRLRGSTSETPAPARVRLAPAEAALPAERRPALPGRGATPPGRRRRSTRGLHR